MPANTPVHGAPANRPIAMAAAASSMKLSLAFVLLLSGTYTPLAPALGDVIRNEEVAF